MTLLQKITHKLSGLSKEKQGKVLSFIDEIENNSEENDWNNFSVQSIMSEHAAEGSVTYSESDIKEKWS